MKWEPHTDQHTQPRLEIYFGSALDCVEDTDEWMFVKTGGALAAVKVVENGQNGCECPASGDVFILTWLPGSREQFLF